MIQIEMEMSEKCSECRFRTDYDYCSAMPKNFCGNTSEEGKPDWCPLKNADGWISVKDRLPETNDEVLTTYLYDDKPNNRYVETASYFDDGDGEGHWYSVLDGFSIGLVRKTTIAWMPMPKPYKPPKEESND